MTDRLEELSKQGVSIWLDDISRERLKTGGLQALAKNQHVVGVTSNPTIFSKAVADADDYADQVADLARRNVSVDEAVRAITTYDVRWACDVLRHVWEETEGLDGRVSIEVDPRLAHDTQTTVAEARALWWLVDRPNLFVKIPATVEGLAAITESLAEGISINVTLIFGLDRYDQVMDAFMTGLERAKEAGRDISTIASVASFFVSRVDTEVDKRLEKVGGGEATALRSTAAIANARAAYERYEKAFDTPRWRQLAEAGARPQRPLWASTSVKDPSLPDTMYVTELVAPGTVNTMPEATLHAVADHAEIRGDTVRPNAEAARATLQQLAKVGIDYDDVIRVLEEEGVSKFEASWADLAETVGRELEKAREGVSR